MQGKVHAQSYGLNAPPAFAPCNGTTPTVTALDSGTESATYLIPRDAQRKFIRLTVRLLLP